ncbi:MAG: DNA polymerase III subunit gamma/tau [Chloroflexi bacterium]|nr:DNA polymerase III subunit gamma/tau [Chloroflexota bacterium]
MASQALYRKWRSQTFDEVVSQEHVTRTLRNALRDGRVAHAYLFTGPRGTGKTSMARLLAKAVNCIGETEEKPCNQCAVCQSITEGRSLDLVEIDAASNRGIDEVRDLRDKVRFRPNECRYRVYILDEAHMLTTPAFNALLKTLEEPPEHAIFILVTTEPQNIPITILSRCQRFDFHRIPLAETVAHLKHIAADEGLRITDAALELVARHATGSMRDALSLLDQLMAYSQEEIAPERVYAVLGTAPEAAMGALVEAMAAQDLAAGLRALNEALDRGAEPRQLAGDLLEYLRGVLLLKAGGEAGLLNATTETLARMRDLAQRLSIARLLAAIRAFNQAALDLKGGMHPRLPLEIALVGLALGDQAGTEPLAQVGVASQPETASSHAAVARPRAEAPAHTRRAPEVAAPPVERAQKAAETPRAADTPRAEERPAPVAKEAPPESPKEEAPAPRAPASQATLSLEWFRENWREVVAAVRARNRGVEALLKGSCEPMAYHDGVLTLGFYPEYQSFHRDRVEQPKSRQVVEEALSEVAGTKVGLKCANFQGEANRVQRETQAARQEREQTVVLDPLVEEAVQKHGARVTSVRPVEE